MLKRIVIAFLLLTGPALAQQQAPTVEESLRWQVQVNLSNLAQSIDQLLARVGAQAQELRADEAQKATLIDWLKAAQAEARKP